MSFVASTFGYDYLSHRHFVNRCQRLSTHEFIIILQYSTGLDCVNNVTPETCTSYVSIFMSPKKKTIQYRTVLTLTQSKCANYSSKEFSFIRKSYILMIVIPVSVCRTGVYSPRIIIFLNASSTFSSEADS